MYTHESSMRMYAQACVRSLISKTLEHQFLGSKASLLDGPQPLEPRECPKPSK